MSKGRRIPPTMTAALKDYERTATKVLQTFVTRIEAASQPPMIYHYTNDAGLKGIIESGKHGEPMTFAGLWDERKNQATGERC
jgi:hypothetical protein